MRLAEIGTCDELSLLGSRGSRLGQDRVAELYPYFANFSIWEYVDDEADLAVSSVTGLP